MCGKFAFLVDTVFLRFGAFPFLCFRVGRRYFPSFRMFS